MLSQDDIKVLLDAVEMWKDAMPMEGAHMVGVMHGMMQGDEQQIKEALVKAAQEAERKRTTRKETGILLQAKLIQMRDQLIVKEELNLLRT